MKRTSIIVFLAFLLVVIGNTVAAGNPPTDQSPGKAR